MQQTSGLTTSRRMATMLSYLSHHSTNTLPIRPWPALTCPLAFLFLWNLVGYSRVSNEQNHTASLVGTFHRSKHYAAPHTRHLPLQTTGEIDYYGAFSNGFNETIGRGYSSIPTRRVDRFDCSLRGGCDRCSSIRRETVDPSPSILL